MYYLHRFYRYLTDNKEKRRDVEKIKVNEENYDNFFNIRGDKLWEEQGDPRSTVYGCNKKKLNARYISEDDNNIYFHTNEELNILKEIIKYMIDTGENGLIELVIEYYVEEYKWEIVKNIHSNYFIGSSDNKYHYWEIIIDNDLVWVHVNSMYRENIIELWNNVSLEILCKNQNFNLCSFAYNKINADIFAGYEYGMYILEHHAQRKSNIIKYKQPQTISFDKTNCNDNDLKIIIDEQHRNGYEMKVISNSIDISWRRYQIYFYKQSSEFQIACATALKILEKLFSINKFKLVST